MYQLIASDLDGTLLDPNHQIPASTIHLLNQLARQDVHILIASGRHYRDVSGIAKQFDFPMYLITANGARVHTHNGEVLRSADVPATIVDEILKMTQNASCYRNLYHDDYWFVEKANDRVLSYTGVSGFSYTRTDFTQVTRDGISKMLFIGEPDELNIMAHNFTERYGTSLNITFSLPTCLEIMAPEANKGEALAAVLKQLNLTPQQAIAFGDGLNDKEMLEYVGEGVLMGNADQRLVAALPNNPMTLTNAKEGVAEYLRKAFAKAL